MLAEVAGPKARFLRVYATYLAGERRKEEERVEKGGPLGKAEAGAATRGERTLGVACYFGGGYLDVI